MPRARKIKVVYRKLGKEKAYGICHSDGLIEIDERLAGKKFIETLTHELFHALFPSLSEEEVIEKSIIYTNTVWNEGLRRIDQHTSHPLQDGSL